MRKTPARARLLGCTCAAMLGGASGCGGDAPEPTAAMESLTLTTTAEPDEDSTSSPLSPTSDTSATDDSTTADDSTTTSTTATTTDPSTGPAPGECGDGIVDDGEDCDDGNLDDTDACTSACVAAACGDGIVQAGVEACDDGDLEPGDGCDAACHSESCGDSIADPSEDCDDGADGDNDDECTDLCTAPTCGDGFVQPSLAEQCDLGPGNADTGECTTLCKAAACGDGFVQPGEQCDEGADNGDSEACLSTCAVNVCGDGFLGPGEECDDGDDNGEHGACLHSCVVNVCGDAFQGPGEACDDGNANDDDACLTTCALAECGDGHIYDGVEDCDDGNDEPLDGCTPGCVFENIQEASASSMMGLAIGDNAYDGTQAKMACFDLKIAQGATVATGKLQVEVSHPWAGDLTFKLFSPANAKTLAMLSLPGVIEAADNGGSMSNEGSDLALGAPLLFRDAGLKNAEQMGNTLDNTKTICKDDAACDYIPNRGSATSLLNFAALAGTPAVGTWKFCVGDSAAGNAGLLKSAKLTLLMQ